MADKDDSDQGDSSEEEEMLQTQHQQQRLVLLLSAGVAIAICQAAIELVTPLIDRTEQKDLTQWQAEQKQAELEESRRREQILSLRRDYERRVEQFREEHAELFGSETIDGSNSPDLSRPPSPVGPSRWAQQRHDEAEQVVTQKLDPQDNAAARLAADGPFVVVAKQGPMWNGGD